MTKENNRMVLSIHVEEQGTIPKHFLLLNLNVPQKKTHTLASAVINPAN